MSAADSPLDPARVPPRMKAAIVVRLLLGEGASLPLRRLPEPLQDALAREIGALPALDRETVAAVAREFAEALAETGLSGPGGMEGALALLDGQISPRMAARLRREAGIEMLGDPWERLASMGAETLGAIVARESVEIGAVVLSKLPVSTAAEILGAQPGPRARQLAYAMSLTSAVTPEAVARIGHSLARQLDAEPVSAFDDGPVERVGAILNFSPAATRDDVLAALDEADEGFARAVRKAIFTFANIPGRIDPRDVPRILRAIPPDTAQTALAAALAGPLAEAAEFVLANISQRVADQLRDDIAEAGPVTEAAGEEAMAAFVAQIRGMEAAGEIIFLAEED